VLLSTTNVISLPFFGESTSVELSRDFTVPFTVWLAGVAVFFAEDEADCGTAANALPATVNAPTNTRVPTM
jgi:hypothetical protein